MQRGRNIGITTIAMESTGVYWIPVFEILEARGFEVLLVNAASSNPDARLAIDMFCYSVRKQIAAMMAALGGVDLLVFTGGIGENDGEVRASICAGLSWAGVRLDATHNRSNHTPVSNAPVARVLILPSQEDEQIARHTGIIVC